MAIYEITSDSLRELKETSYAKAGVKERNDLQRFGIPLDRNGLRLTGAGLYLQGDAAYFDRRSVYRSWRGV
ncbi:MAG TPA: hypothetical protein DCM07_27960 [Planctomycetaceae bacterium]|uniref:hypothetical protein n=1 Tax=Gimesia sp. TaxID=2024833 RepID=UPI000C4B3BF5|nr:hypothetical protein [Gimesia sp.]MAX35504.1 hypothetical protein [Gimesia sp.]HAH48610.1 hypothetical protein [Planctomycetaceae bacterium]